MHGECPPDDLGISLDAPERIVGFQPVALATARVSKKGGQAPEPPQPEELRRFWRPLLLKQIDIIIFCVNGERPEIEKSSNEK